MVLAVAADEVVPAEVDQEVVEEEARPEAEVVPEEEAEVVHQRQKVSVADTSQKALLFR